MHCRRRRRHCTQLPHVFQIRFSCREITERHLPDCQEEGHLPVKANKAASQHIHMHTQINNLSEPEPSISIISGVLNATRRNWNDPFFDLCQISLALFCRHSVPFLHLASTFGSSPLFADGCWQNDVEPETQTKSNRDRASLELAAVAAAAAAARDLPKGLRLPLEPVPWSLTIWGGLHVPRGRRLGVVT